METGNCITDREAQSVKFHNKGLTVTISAKRSVAGWSCSHDGCRFKIPAENDPVITERDDNGSINYRHLLSRARRQGGRSYWPCSGPDESGLVSEAAAHWYRAFRTPQAPTHEPTEASGAASTGSQDPVTASAPTSAAPSDFVPGRVMEPPTSTTFDTQTLGSRRS